MFFNNIEIKAGQPHTFSQYAPLVFQWLPRNYGDVMPSDVLERISDWGKAESQRKILLVINGSGFYSEQREELESKILSQSFNPNKNISVVDFNYLDLGNHDFTFHSTKNVKTKINEYKFSEYFDKLYSIPSEERVKFSVEIDSMRVVMLLAMLNSHYELIYMDTDVFPEKGKQIGKLKAPQGFLLAESDKSSYSYQGITEFENSIMAVSLPGKRKLEEIHYLTVDSFKSKYFLIQDHPHYIYTNICNVITYAPIDINQLNKKIPSFFSNLRSVRDYDKQEVKNRANTFGFQSNGGNARIAYEHSWQTEDEKKESLMNELAQANSSHENNYSFCS